MQTQRSNLKSMTESRHKIEQQKNGHSENPHTNRKNPSSNRSKLSTATFIRWLRSRFQSSLPKRYPYLYFPHQLTRQTSIQQIFTEFDADGSGGLSRDQVFDMFRGFGINITMDHLNQLYDSVQVDLQELNCEMFKKCALGQKSNKVFRQIVRQIECGYSSYCQEQKKYLPHNFTNMIIYLVYLSKRQELKNQIEKDKIPIEEKVNNIENLLKLRDLSLNNQRLTLYSDNMKKNLKNKFRDIWERVNQKHGQKFPMTPKLEQEFYKFYLIKQGLLQNDRSIFTTAKNTQRSHKTHGTKKRI